MGQAREVRTERQNAYGTSKEQILSAAEELFACNGFSRTTLKDVARQSGANTALVGYHFGSKDGLRSAVIKRQLELVREDFNPIMNLPGELDGGRLEQLVDALLDAAGSSKTLYCLHLWGLVDGKEQAQHVMAEVYEPIISCISDVIERYWQHKAPRAHSSDSLNAECKAYLVFGLMDQYAISKWHLFEMAKLRDRDDFLRCHRSFLKATILNVINGEQ